MKIPEFENESEEADWWANNPDFVLQELKRAKAEGRLGHGTAMRQMTEKQAAKSITIHRASRFAGARPQLMYPESKSRFPRCATEWKCKEGEE